MPNVELLNIPKMLRDDDEQLTELAPDRSIRTRSVDLMEDEGDAILQVLEDDHSIDMNYRSVHDDRHISRSLSAANEIKPLEHRFSKRFEYLTSIDRNFGVVKHANDWGAAFSDSSHHLLGNRKCYESYDNFSLEQKVKQLTLFALCIAILEKSASGIGTLAFIWASVVLLGGFATVLDTKDFWFVTVITLMEGTRIYTTNHELDSSFFFRAMKAVFELFPSDEFDEPTIRDQIGGILLTLLQLLSASGCVTLSLMRLILQRYGEADQDISKRNRNAALDIFYGLALVQALLFLTEKVIWHWKITYRKMLEGVNLKCGFSPSGIILVRRFFHAAYWKCIKGSMFDAIDMDLISFGQELLCSSSRGDQFLGCRILHRFVRHETYGIETLQKIRTSNKTVGILINMLSWKCPDDTVIRLHAARIMAKLAGEKENVLTIVGVPGAMQLISTLLHTKSENSYGENILIRATDVFNLLGLQLLKRLAEDSHNCRQILNAPGLLSKVIAFMKHNQDLVSHDERTMKKIKRSLKLVNRLVSTGGKIGQVLRREISENVFTISSIREILEYGEDYPVLLKLGIEILTNLALDKTTRAKIGSTGQIIKQLLSFLFKENLNVSIAAGDALAMLAVGNKVNCAKILKGSEMVVQRLIYMLDDKKFFVTASKILQNLCAYSGTDSFGRLRESIMGLPKVLRAIMISRGEQLEASVGLSVQICKFMDPEDYAKELQRSNILEVRLVERLADILDKFNYPTIEYPRIRRYVIEKAIWLMKANDSYIELFREYGMVELLEDVLDTTMEIECFELLSGTVGVKKHARTVSSIVKIALQLMGIN